MERFRLLRRSLPPAPIGTTSSLPAVMPSDLFVGGDSGIKPFAYIPAGATNVTISIDSYGMDDDLQLFARNRDHIWGTGLPDLVWIDQGIKLNNVLLQKNYLLSI